MSDKHKTDSVSALSSEPKQLFDDVLSGNEDLFHCVRMEGSSKLHYHNCIELIQSESDDLVIHVGNNTYTIDSDDFIVILPGEQHSIEASDPEMTYLVADFEQNFVFSSSLSSEDLKYILPVESMRVFRHKDHYSVSGKSSILSEINSSLISRSLGIVISECEERKRFFKLSVRADLAFLSLFFLRQWEEADMLSRDNVSDKAGIARIGQVIEVVNTRYMDNLTSEEMAELVGMSYSYFSRFFKNTMNVTFSEYLNRKRIDEGEALLRDTEMSVAEIAEAIGYSNASYFISQFKKRRMMTPKKYRIRYGSR